MKKINLLPVLISLLFVSCTDHPFNQYPVEIVNYARIFSDSIRTLGVVNAAYSQLAYDGTYFRIGGVAMQACATDEAKLAVTNVNIDNFVAGRWDPNNIPDPAWTEMYQGIRQVNLFLPYWKEKTLLPLTESSYRRSYSELLFLRAFYYFGLFKRYGGVPILTAALNPGDNMQIPRSTYSETLNFIVSQCDSAAFYAKLNANSTSDFGRVTKGAIYALKSRVLLYAASPLVNSVADYANGSDLNIWQGSYDIERWKLAAEAAMQVIDLNQYQLYDGYDYSPYFNDSYLTNKEFIFGRLSTNDNNMEIQNSPLGYANALGMTCPSQDFVDAFETMNGEKFDWNDPEQASDPYSKRDPRLDMFVFHNGSKWWYSANRQSSFDKTTGYIETFKGGADDPSIDPSAIRTGYYLRKFSAIQATIFGTVAVANHNFTIFRYAEILLNFAEAANEYQGPDFEINGMSARMAINEIRQRVGMPVVDENITQDEFREKIRNERRIELAFEEHRFWDIRRWKIALGLKKNIDGIKIEKNNDDTYTYTRIQNIEPRVFELKHYFYPIPQWEINRNQTLKQNPEW